MNDVIQDSNNSSEKSLQLIESIKFNFNNIKNQIINNNSTINTINKIEINKNDKENENITIDSYIMLLINSSLSSHINIENLSIDLECYKYKFNQLNNNVIIKDKMINDLNNEIKLLKSNNDKLINDKQMLSNEIVSYKSNENNLNNKFNQLQLLYNEMKNNYDQLDEKLNDTLVNDINNNNDINQYKENEMKFNQQVNDLNDSITRLNNQLVHEKSLNHKLSIDLINSNYHINSLNIINKSTENNNVVDDLVKKLNEISQTIIKYYSNIQSLDYRIKDAYNRTTAILDDCNNKLQSLTTISDNILTNNNTIDTPIISSNQLKRPLDDIINGDSVHKSKAKKVDSCNYCHQKSKGIMIECKVCYNEYHTKCAKESSDAKISIDKYICKDCSEKS